MKCAMAAIEIMRQQHESNGGEIEAKEMAYVSRENGGNLIGGFIGAAY